MVLEFGPGNMIGGYEVTFNKRSIYKYKVRRPIEGYFIRKKNFVSLLLDHGDMFAQLKQQILRTYLKMRIRIEAIRKKETKRLRSRADVEGIWTL